MCNTGSLQVTGGPWRWLTVRGTLPGMTDETRPGLAEVLASLPPHRGMPDDGEVWGKLQEEFPDPLDAIDESDWPADGTAEEAEITKKAAEAFDARVNALIDRAGDGDAAAYRFLWNMLYHYENDV